MKVYYRYSRFDVKKIIYELNIHYQSYIITVFLFSRSLPIKRLTKERPLDYFKISKHELNLSIFKIKGETRVSIRDILIKNPDTKLLSHLVKKAKPHIHYIRLTEGEVEEIITEFLKSL
jgi:hypothetical protein